MLKITNTLIKRAAESRNWTVEILSEEAGLLRYTLPSGQKLVLKSTLSPFTPATAEKIANDKYATFVLAKESGVPVAETYQVGSIGETLDLLGELDSIVIKPAGEAHGNGVTTQISNAEQAKQAYGLAESFDSRILVQPHLQGDDLRLLYIGGKLAAAAIRHPASVVGDGVASIRELIEAENSSGERASDYYKSLNFIDLQAAERFLGEAIETVPESGEQRTVAGTANIGTGGQAEDITDTVEEEIVRDGLKALQAIGLETGAADFIANDNSHALLEINSNPSFGMHTYPSRGESRDVADMHLDWIEDLALRAS